MGYEKNEHKIYEARNESKRRMTVMIYLLNVLSDNFSEYNSNTQNVEKLHKINCELTMKMIKLHLYTQSSEERFCCQLNYQSVKGKKTLLTVLK